MSAKRIVLIIGGGIAAYKCLELIRRLRERGIGVRVVMTKAAQQFVTPLAAGALSGQKVLGELFDLTDESEIGHIRLSREADLVVVAPATADLMARMAGGHADDLATAVLLATDKPVLIAPAMNPRMWQHPATRRNLAQLAADGIHCVGPNCGEMAESGEAGPGRMAEPAEILTATLSLLEGERRGPLAGRRVLVTSGPTHEPIDPVRYIANRSSGKQGYAIARAAARLGAAVTLVSGPTGLADPAGVAVVRVETAKEMLEAARKALPADIAVFAAAVADWRVASAATEKLKKTADSPTPQLELVQNPDILATLAKAGPKRPRLVVGFAAETEKVIEHARRKLAAKGADWIVANDVSPETGIMGGDSNTVHLVTAKAIETWPTLSKDAVAERLIARAAEFLAGDGEGASDRAGPTEPRAPKAATLAIDGAGADILPEQPPRKTAAATVEVAVCRLAHAEGLPLPAYQSEGAAGLDLSAALGPDGKLKIKPGRSTLVPTGLALAIPPGFEGQVRPRSGLALRHGLTVLNAPGTIDSDFRGEVKVLLVNLGVDRVHIAHGDRIAQLVIAPVSRAVLVETAELPVSPRGDGGFGSTGTAAAKRSSRKRH